MSNPFDRRKQDLKEFKETRKQIKTVVLKKDIPNGLYEKCPACKKAFHIKEIKDNLYVCPNCDENFRLRSIDRIELTVDDNTFEERGVGFITLNPLDDSKYDDKIDALKDSTGLEEAYIYGTCKIEGTKCVIGVMDSYFMMGSMGSVVGEKVTKSFEYGNKHNLPVLIFSASGGARMQEGIFSLMQMAKTSAEIARFGNKKGLFISILTHPTTGGVTASFASLGDIILAEPRALIGFAGPRVIEQTINQKLPEGFQRSEFLVEKGFVDKVVERKDLRSTLGKLLKMHRGD
ncbi:acetyl-CoA carboxylase, carboxyltransferase subunit beta [Mycoplasmatota bacterium WC44]